MKNSLAASNAPRKRSVIVCNKCTSISLEDSFWHSLHVVVRMENTTIRDFVEKIARRGSSNLSSSLRVAVLEYFQHLAAGLKPDVLAPAREPER
jgi:predicted DNA-binding ribbon-helix-helix protein